MKKIVLLVLVVGGAIAGYRWDRDRRAFGAYEGFAEAWVHEDKTAAAKYGDAATVEHAFERRALRGTKGGAAMEAFRGTRYTVESKSHAADGVVDLVVRQTVLFDPPGVTSGVGGAMFANYRHAATVRATKDGWRVVAFEPTYVDMGEIKRRSP